MESPLWFWNLVMLFLKGRWACFSREYPGYSELYKLANIDTLYQAWKFDIDTKYGDLEKIPLLKN